MEIGQIEAFERVARDGNFSRAAEALGLTQPAVSARIAILEAELGGQLFERRGRQFRLTPLGECFLPYAQRMLAVLADSRQAVEDLQHGRRGQVKLAAPTPFVLSFLVEALADFREKHPTADVLIRERNKTAIVEMLHDGVITLGLVNAPMFDRQFVSLLRLRDPIRAVVGSGHVLASAETIHMDDLYQHTIFRVSMFPQMTAFMDSIVEQARHGSGGAVIALPMVMALKLVIMGQGVTFLPESYVRDALAEGDVRYLKIVDMPELVSEPVIIAHRDRELDDIHRAFVQVFKSRWRHLVKG